jgi:hypothetical protein
LVAMSVPAFPRRRGWSRVWQVSWLMASDPGKPSHPDYGDSGWPVFAIYSCGAASGSNGIPFSWRGEAPHQILYVKEPTNILQDPRNINGAKTGWVPSQKKDGRLGNHKDGRSTGYHTSTPTRPQSQKTGLKARFWV